MQFLFFLSESVIARLQCSSLASALYCEKRPQGSHTTFTTCRAAALLVERGRDADVNTPPPIHFYPKLKSLRANPLGTHDANQAQSLAEIPLRVTNEMNDNLHSFFLLLAAGEQSH